MKNQVRLMPRYPFRVHGHDIDLERFARVFRLAWRHIPVGERRRLLTYWQALPTYPGFAPRFVILDDLFNRGQDLNALGFCHFGSNSFEFLADAVNLMPDNILSTLIAHELAHVVFRLRCREEQPGDFASGLFLSIEGEPEQEGEGVDDFLSWRWQEEQDVRELQDSWGFDEFDFCAWLDENREHLAQLKGAREEELQAFILAQGA